MTTTERLRVVIVDDEPAAVTKLRDLLSRLDWVEIAGSASDGPAAVAELDRLRPDLVLLDIALPGLSGFEVLERAMHRPLVVFTTAFDRYAVTAFELQAVDYLLKPFGRERLQPVLERVRRAVADGDTASRALLAARHREPLRRIFVRYGDAVHAVDLDEVERFEARDDFVAAFVAGGRHLLSVRMDDLEDRLDPARFARVHRSHIVNLARVREVRRADDKRLAITLASGATVVSSRSRTPALRQRMRRPSA